MPQVWSPPTSPHRDEPTVKLALSLTLLAVVSAEIICDAVWRERRCFFVVAAAAASAAAAPGTTSLSAVIRAAISAAAASRDSLFLLAPLANGRRSQSRQRQQIVETA